MAKIVLTDDLKVRLSDSIGKGTFYIENFPEFRGGGVLTDDLKNRLSACIEKGELDTRNFPELMNKDGGGAVAMFRFRIIE
jgi:hypothetical protein